MKKRALSLLMAVIMVVSLLPTAVWAAGETVEITNAKGFSEMAADGNYILMSDITITAPYGGGSTLSNITQFTGTFDGNGHTITLKINDAENHYQGAFAYIGAGGTVKNLITSGTVSVVKSKYYVGGIAGMCEGTIQDCGNTAAVTGSKQVGGITGQLSDKSVATIQNCYNTGTITGPSSGRSAANTTTGGIVGKVNSNGKVQNCSNSGSVSAKKSGALVGYCGGPLNNSWWGGNCALDSAAGFISDTNNISNKQYTDAQTAVTALNTNRGNNAEWTVKDGAPTLKLVQKGGASTEPTIEIKPNETTLYVQTGSNFVNETTLTATATNLPKGATIQWACDNADAAALVTDPNNDKSVTVKAASIGGVATVTATVCVDGKPVTTADSPVQASCEVTVIPHITTIEIQGTPAVGQTLQARAYLEGGETFYDEIKGLPKLSFTWKKQVGSDYEEVGTGDTLKVTDALLGCNLWLYTWYGSENKISNTAFGPIVSAADGYLKEDASWLYDQMLQYKDVEFKADTTLSLPKTATPHGSTITWKCDPAGIINTETGKLTLPETGEKPVVKLTATLTNTGETTTRNYEIKVWSKKDLADYDADLTQKLTDDVNKALGEWYKLTPVYGTDTNVLTMVTNDLDRDDITVTMGTPVRTNATSNMAETVTNIANDGTITYFYIDPNSDPMQNTQRFGTFSVPFTFTRDGVSVTRNVSVTVYWDRDKVTKAMEDQIVPGLPKISGEVTELSSLLSTVNNKTWTGIEWSSNDNAITFKKPAATDPFGPWEVVVRGSSVAKDVTLTAKLTFRYTNDVTGSEEPITILKYFYVTVPASDDGKKYQDALDAVFNDDSLKDITGDSITSADGVYSVSGDIQFPITGDLNRYMLDKYGEGHGFDGKYTPVLITSSDPDVIKAPDVANAARAEVYRPAPGQSAQTVTLTVRILDRPSGQGRDYASMPVLAEKTFTFQVQPITTEEVRAELDLMQQVKEHYWDGIKNGNAYPQDVTSDLDPFVEVYQQDGKLVWVRDVKQMSNSGIVPVAMDGWQELEAWRLFQSSNPTAVSHENLLVTRQFEGKAVTITSALSSETLGRYGQLYRSDTTKYADYASLADLYYQTVSANLIVRGYNEANMTEETVTGADGKSETIKVSTPKSETISVTFTLSGNGALWMDTTTLSDLPEGTTVYDVLQQLQREGKLTFQHKGGYVSSITFGDKTLTELEEGENSGWMYRVNSVLPDVYMSAYGLKNGDNIRVFFTTDYTKESGGHGGSAPSTVPTTPEQPTGLPFTDVQADAWYADAVKYVFDQGLMSGMSAQEFGPDGQVTRGQVVTILWRLAGSPTVSGKAFPDVSASAWYADAVAWASANGVVSGYENGGFGPGDPVTREQLAAILYRYAQLSGKDTDQTADLSGYTDSVTISAWAPQALKWAVGSGLISGTGTHTLSPRGTATRAQIAVILQNFCK